MRWIAALMLTTAACSLPDPDPPDPAEPLVLELGDPSPDVRERAEAGLAALGDAAAHALRRALSSSDSETALRARRLYRRACARRLELSLSAPREKDGYLLIDSSMKNGSDGDVVLVKVNFYYEARLAIAFLAPGESQPSWRRTVWKHGCTDVHPFTESEFVVIPPGESRSLGTLLVYRIDLLDGPHTPEGPHTLVGRYSFRRPTELDPRHLPTPRIRQLYEDALEVEGVHSEPISATPQR